MATRPADRAVAAAPWARPAAEVAAELDVDPRTGLDDASAATRLAADGPNEVRSRRPVSLLQTVLGQLRNVLILVLLAAALRPEVVGDDVDGVVFMLGI
jgi:Ca2+-transporting ATPase